MTSSGRLRPESFDVTSPQRFAALVRAQRPRDVLENALARLPERLSATTRADHARRSAFIGLAAVLAVAIAAASGEAPVGDRLDAPCGSVLRIDRPAGGRVGRKGRRKARPASSRTTNCRPTPSSSPSIARRTSCGNSSTRSNALDYPESKLDIKLVVERRDRETLSRLLALDLPGRYEVVVAPPGEPSTKPRALNLALAEARGELLVVYDAEDIPAPGQLRLAASRFAAERDLDCLQARLTVRNCRQFLAVAPVRAGVCGLCST